MWYFSSHENAGGGVRVPEPPIMMTWLLFPLAGIRENWRKHGQVKGEHVHLGWCPFQQGWDRRMGQQLASTTGWTHRRPEWQPSGWRIPEGVWGNWQCTCVEVRVHHYVDWEREKMGVPKSILFLKDTDEYDKHHLTSAIDLKTWLGSS